MSLLHAALLALPASLALASAAGALTTELVVGGLDEPLFVTAAPGDDERLFILEQHTGRIRIFDLGSQELLPTDFLTIAGVGSDNEQGLLGLAFHPQYATNGRFYVNITNAEGDTEIRRYEVSANPNVADPQSMEPVLGFEQPQANHNGGWLGFGPDGYLYISSGDGGGSNDTGTGHTAGTGNAQDLTSNLLGKMLRIDVDGDDFPSNDERSYAIPETNPFVGRTGDDEIWSYGLRNPWRASFDRMTGDLWIGDVGQASREEIDFQPAASDGGENYGWRLREGTIANPVVGGPPPAGAVEPIYDYTRGDAPFQGRSVTGGYVYRGPIEAIQGVYFFGDYVRARIWSLRFDGSSPGQLDGTNYTDLTDRTAELAPPQGSIDFIASFGEDAAGNLYIVDLGGEVFRVVESAAAVCGDPVEPSLINASDALHALRASVGTGSCAACVCDVNDSGDVTATDALAILRVAVGNSIELTCPAC
jgi:glucose/arabinose dehydrogenase